MDAVSGDVNGHDACQHLTSRKSALDRQSTGDQRQEEGKSYRPRSPRSGSSLVAQVSLWISLRSLLPRGRRVGESFFELADRIRREGMVLYER